MKRILNISNTYILLWVLYSIQGLLYPTGTIISRSLLGIVLLTSIYHFILLNIAKEKLPNVLRCLSYLIIFFSLYGIVYMIIGEENSITHAPKFEYLKEIYVALLPIYSFYYFTKIGLLSEEMLKKWAIIFFIIAIAGFYYCTLDNTAYQVSSSEYEADFTNNAGYIVLSLLPITILFKKAPIVHYVLLAIALVLILTSMKRGAILIAGICALCFFYNSYIDASKVEKKWLFIMGAVMCVCLVRYILYLLTTNEYFLKRIEQTQEGDSSLRFELYSKLINHFLNETTVVEFLIGSGANSSINIAGNYAHNDWLEIAVNNGLGGIIIYIIYWTSLIKMCRIAKPYRQQYMIITAFTFITFLKTLFSMSYNDMSIYMTSAFAWALATLPKTPQMINEK